MILVKTYFIKISQFPLLNMISQCPPCSQKFWSHDPHLRIQIVFERVILNRCRSFRLQRCRLRNTLLRIHLQFEHFIQWHLENIRNTQISLWLNLFSFLFFFPDFLCLQCFLQLTLSLFAFRVLFALPQAFPSLSME